MKSSVYEQVWKVLQQRGLLGKSWVVERATLPEQVFWIYVITSLKLPTSHS